MEADLKPKVADKSIINKELVDYSKSSFMTYFIDDGCKYSLSITEEYKFDIAKLIPTGIFIIVVTSPKGTYFTRMARRKDNFGWNTDQKGFREIVGEKVYSLIEIKLH